MDMDSMSALEVLKEIKQIMDERLGDKFGAKEDPKELVEDALETAPDAKGLEVSKVKVLGGKKPGEEEGLTPEEDAVEDKKEMDGVDPEVLRKIRQTMM